MKVRKIDHREPTALRRLYELVQLAYREEAQLIGVESFPPLLRTEADIQRSRGEFYGCHSESEIMGAIELEKDGNGIRIASLVVHPQRIRQGIGAALVLHATEWAQGKPVLVQTAQANFKAVGLYVKLGFEPVREFTSRDGFGLVELRK